MIDYTTEIDKYLKRLFPINRSITGNGNRETLKILQELIPLKIIEYPTGQEVYDWTIPKEWNIHDAWIKNSKGEKIVDFKISNLHVVSYSIPVHKKISFSALKKHLHYLEDLPEAIPYRTSYYNEDWGFCLSYNQYKKYFHNNEKYEVFIDSELNYGSLSLGEIVLNGNSSKEILISCYFCHPSMANDSLSGVVLTAFLTKELMKLNLNYTYRIIFAPETIGAIAYCANNELHMKNIKEGLVITTCGGPGKFGYKQSWDKNHSINNMIEDVFKEYNKDFITYPFDIHGSDERQYSSQAFRINCVTISKDKYYEYDYYHTSLDNLNFVKGQYINESLKLYYSLISKIEKNLKFKNLMPTCEVMLSKYDLYPKMGGTINQLISNSKKNELDIILELLFYCDGEVSLYNLSRQLEMDLNVLYEIAIKIKNKYILEIVE